MGFPDDGKRVWIRSWEFWCLHIAGSEGNEEMFHVPQKTERRLCYRSRLAGSEDDVFLKEPFE